MHSASWRFENGVEAGHDVDGVAGIDEPLELVELVCEPPLVECSADTAVDLRMLCPLGRLLLAPERFVQLFRRASHR